MRPVGTLQNEQQARAFGDYLVTLDIANQVDPSKGGWIVWVINEDDVARAAQEFVQFGANPDDERYDQAGAARKLREEARREDEARARRITSPRQEWFNETRALAGGLRRMPLRESLVTLLLIGACIGVAIATDLGKKSDNGVMNALLIAPVDIVDNHIEWNGLEAIRHGQIWRLFTSMLLHFGLLHIVFNLWWLRDFGMMIEPAKGSLKFAALVLVTSAVSNLAQYAWDGPYSGGMSGVIYGLYGYIWMRQRFAPWDGLAVSKVTDVVLIAWLFICMTGWVGPIGNAAHVAGLVTGLAAGYAPVLWSRLRRQA